MILTCPRCGVECTKRYDDYFCDNPMCLRYQEQILTKEQALASKRCLICGTPGARYCKSCISQEQNAGENL